MTNVKRIVVSIVALLLGSSATAPAIAQTATTAPAQTPAAGSPPATAPTQKPTETKQKSVEAKKTKQAQGMVKSASPDSVVVAGKEGSKDTEWTFAVDSKTAIRKSGKAITPTDLKAGDQVQVRYLDQAGKATAVAVQVKPSTAAAKPAAKK
jgi:hypothetical protein